MLMTITRTGLLVGKSYLQHSWRRELVLGILCPLSFSFVALQCLAIQFIPLGPGYSASDVSGDGSTVIGTSTTLPESAFRWTATRGFEVLNGIESAEAISFDGSAILGQSKANNMQTAIWSENGIQIIPTTANTPLVGRGISADGQVVVGYAYVNDLYKSFRWDAHTGIEVFSNDDQDDVNSANAISSDGKVIVGNDGSLAYVWTRETGLQPLPNAVPESAAWGVSDDGSVIVGSVNNRAFRWAGATGIQLLGAVPGQIEYNHAWDVTPDGSAIVGDSLTSQGFGHFDAFIWTQKLGMQSLASLLTQSGIDLDGWELGSARGISDNGTVIVGSGTNPQGQYEAWVIILPEPTTFAIAAICVCWGFFARRRH